VSLRFILDTNIISEPMRHVPNARVMAHLRSRQKELVIATLVWHELLYGCFRLPPSARRTAIEDYLEQTVALLPMFGYDEVAAEWHAHERARLVGLGKSTPFVDGQIAAIAATNGLTLVTANTADFAVFEGLTLVDWTKA
jgi:tRNA(fMet)-specific endonuclease VapC